MSNTTASPSVLLLCLGNICRSPLAEGALRHELERRGLSWSIDSAGTGAWHVGEPPDSRSIAVARRHGIDIGGQRARQLIARDFVEYDWIVAMDTSCLDTAERRRPGDPEARRARLVPFMQFVPAEVRKGHDVPDPYYGGERAFQEVWDILGQGMPHFVAEVLRVAAVPPSLAPTP
ncbi:MAG: low molecular weight protein-tyrosine-phosphatase [Myxococcota bacterium]